MRNEIELSLQSLISLPFWNAGRAADLEWFQFGNQCDWRILDATGVIVASHDRYKPADEIEDPENFEWDRPGANLCDRKMSQFLARTSGISQIVTQVEADDVGCLRILLSTDVAIEGSAADEYSEHWRFFEPASETEHLVMRNSCLTRE